MLDHCVPDQPSCLSPSSIKVNPQGSNSMLDSSFVSAPSNLMARKLDKAAIVQTPLLPKLKNLVP